MPLRRRMTVGVAVLAFVAVPLMLGQSCIDSPDRNGTGAGDPGDVGAPPNAECTLIFTAIASPSTPDTAIKVVNSLSGGVEVLVEAHTVPLIGMGSSMLPATCELYGVLPDRYDVTLQRCEQAVPGSSTCTSMIGAAVTLQIDVESGETITIDVAQSLF